MKSVHYIAITYIILSISYLVLSFVIYTDTDTYQVKSQEIDVSTASQGRLVWQKYNCQACHQLYGLGGFLGPDLTNVSQKGFFYVDAFLKTGVNSMPKFSLSEEETHQLFEFLKSVDNTGNAAPATYNTFWNGMIQPEHETQP